MTPRQDDSREARQAWRRALEGTAPIGRDPLRTLPVVVDELAARFDAAPALVSRDSCLSYRALAAAAQRYARWALGQRLRNGDVVCLLMPNCPEYLAIWLGITRVGAVVSLLNTHQRGDALAHSIRSVAPRHLIVGEGLVGALEGVRSQLPGDVECWGAGGDRDHDFRDLAAEVARASPEPLARSEYRPPSITDRALYIYTSGTTGLPKAAAVSHYRLLQWSHWFAGLLALRPSDRLYDCLPFYHAAGGVVAPGATLVGGGTLVLRERFSARDFWRDIAAEECTLFQYVGELCRYLVNSPREPWETEHRIRLCCGNGLAPDVWDAFKRRFRIPRILEFYASTEGNFSLYNCEERPGSIGRIPPYLAHRQPVALVKVDIETAQPLRNAAGCCERTATNEVGEALGQILDARTSPAGRFEGYADPEASAQKVLHDVFSSGDAWYRTGDLMRRDERGFFYFVDRIGDSYRWKGENVSSTEVGAALAGCSGVIEALVYGVALPGADGKAGMAALVVGSDFEVSALREEVAARLPDYARPLFLRIVPALEVTGTLRPLKQGLLREGFDPALTGDPLYFDDRRRGAYVRIDAALFDRLWSDTLRV